MSDTQAAMREFRFLDEKRKTNGLTPAEDLRWQDLAASLGVDLSQQQVAEAPQGYYGPDGNWYPYAPQGYDPQTWSAPPAGQWPPGYYAPPPQGYYGPDGQWYQYPPMQQQPYYDPTTGQYYQPPPQQWYPAQPQGYYDQQGQWVPTAPAPPPQWDPQSQQWVQPPAESWPSETPEPAPSWPTEPSAEPAPYASSESAPEVSADEVMEIHDEEVVEISAAPLEPPPAVEDPVADLRNALAFDDEQPELPSLSPIPPPRQDFRPAPTSVEVAPPTPTVSLEPPASVMVEPSAPVFAVDDASVLELADEPTTIEQDPQLLQAVANELHSTEPGFRPHFDLPDFDEPTQVETDSTVVTQPVPMADVPALGARPSERDLPAVLPLIDATEAVPTSSEPLSQLDAVTVDAVAAAGEPPEPSSAPRAITPVEVPVFDATPLASGFSATLDDLPTLEPELPTPAPLGFVPSFDDLPIVEAPPAVPDVAPAPPTTLVAEVTDVPAPPVVSEPSVIVAPTAFEGLALPPDPAPIPTFEPMAPPARAAAPYISSPTPVDAQAFPPWDEVPEPVEAPLHAADVEFGTEWSGEEPVATVELASSAEHPVVPVATDEWADAPVIEATAEGEVELGGDPAQPVVLAGPSEFIGWARPEPATQELEIETDLGDFEVDSAPPAALATGAPQGASQGYDGATVELANNAEFLQHEALTSTGAAWQSDGRGIALEEEESLEADVIQGEVLQGEVLQGDVVQGEVLPADEAEDAELEVDVDEHEPAGDSWGTAVSQPSPLPQRAVPALRPSPPAPLPPPRAPARSPTQPTFQAVQSIPALGDDEAYPGASKSGSMPRAPVPQVAPPFDPSDTDDTPLIIGGEHRVILHTMEGGVKRGSIRDANLAGVQVVLNTAPGATESIPRGRVKAIFFMLAPGSRAPVTEGSKVRVTFRDGRQVAGFSKDFRGTSAGFFVVPADNRTNTERIFIYRHSVAAVAAD